MKTESDYTPIEIYSGSPWQVGMVKTLLEDAGIMVYMQDVIMGTLNPWWTAGGGAGAIRLFISDNDYDTAIGIVEEYERTQE
ncbi:MAG: putative signal transducing protein [Bacteroidales bacterium]